jgi:2-polyprenyl-6-methoxyphenol hydroxylase-like FAD-dependent oxidoreductase
MSPVGGIGLNLAIQDAVATANALAEPLRRGPVEPELLESVQRRRELPTKLTQKLQVAVQDRVLTPVLTGRMGAAPPLILRIISAVPLLQRIPAYVVGIGFRPEHVRSSSRELTA